jgi:hypothetical protein
MKVPHVIRIGLLGGLAALALTTGLQPARADEAPQGLGPLAVYDQTNGASGESVISVNITGVDDNIAADDFSLGAEWWIISQVRAVGSLQPNVPAPNSMLVEIYQTSTNGFAETVPGINIYSKTSTQFTPGATAGDYTITLPTVAIIRPSATYWLAVQALRSRIARSSGRALSAMPPAARTSCTRSPTPPLCPPPSSTCPCSSASSSSSQKKKTGRARSARPVFLF